MSIGGFFLLIIFILVVAALGSGVYLLAARRRRRQLSPEGGTLDAGRPEQEPPRRPEHVEVESEQRARFIGTK